MRSSSDRFRPARRSRSSTRCSPCHGCYISAVAHVGAIGLPRAFRSFAAAPAWAGAAVAIPPLAGVGWGLAFFTLVNACVELEQRRRWPAGAGSRWIAAIGLMSYSLYLVHLPVQMLLQSLSLRIGPAMTLSLFALRTAALVAGSLAAARVFFHLIESRVLSAQLPAERALSSQRRELRPSVS